MKVSLNTVKQYIDFELPPVAELVERINRQLGGVEEVIDLGAKYKDALIVKVIECDKHPNADRLNVTKIDDGGVRQGVERDENGLVQVVCGAPNVHADMWAVWLPPESTVPSSFDDAEPFVLGARELRGVMSNGMLAAGDELAINSDHDGIIEITDADLVQGASLDRGAGFARVFGLDDTIIDIENKMFTHRPDLFGQLGVAREISAIIKGLRHDDEDAGDTRFVNPDWYWQVSEFTTASGLALTVTNQAVDKVPRLMTVAMSGITIGPSPLWLQCALVAMGSKAINNIVDVTNYVMLLTAQPTHAYDYDKLRGHTIGARMARDGESIKLLNDKTYTLTSDDIVIVDGEGPIGLGGIMGGGDSEVDESTTNIVLEVANFDMYTVRKMSMRHGIFTDALTRFNKGQSPLQNDRVMKLLMTSIQDVSSAKQASNVYDLPSRNGQPWQDSLSGEIAVTTEFINTRLGLTLEQQQVGDLLRRVNFASYPDEKDAGTLLITAPFWRTDIELPEDIVEEVGRLYGFDKLPRELPTRSISPAPVNPLVATKRQLRQALQRAGANEVLTYSFVHEKVLLGAGQNPAKAFRLSNALSPDLQYYRLSVVPSLLSHVRSNIKAGYDEFALYEIGKAHHKDMVDDGLPKELDRLAIVYANKRATDGSPYYQAQSIVRALARDFHFDDELSLQPLHEFDDHGFDALKQLIAPFDPSRSVMLWVGEQFGGVVGELKSSVAARFKLPESVAAAELFLSMFSKAPNRVAYRALSKYPSVTQDVTLDVSTDESFAAVQARVMDVLDSYRAKFTIDIKPLTIYQADDDRTRKSISFRLVVTSQTQTLTDADVSVITEALVR